MISVQNKWFCFSLNFHVAEFILYNEITKLKEKQNRIGLIISGKFVMRNTLNVAETSKCVYDAKYAHTWFTSLLRSHKMIKQTKYNDFVVLNTSFSQWSRWRDRSPLNKDTRLQCIMLVHLLCYPLHWNTRKKK